MKGLHTTDGLTFQRLGDGSVRVVHYLSGFANPGQSDQMVVDIVDLKWTLDPGVWASVVAAVSEKGETGDTFRAALDFHGVPDE